MRRTLKNNLDSILPIFHEVLLLVENDEMNHRKGCDWTYVKKNLQESLISDSENGITRIISGAEKYSLDLAKTGALASLFLIRFRDAFAHNYVLYNPSKRIIEVDMDSIVNNTKVLKGRITESAFIEIIKLIKESKVNKLNSNKSL